MPIGLDHEFLVEMFRRRPELARVLLRECKGIELAGARAELASIDLSQAVPIEYRADVVVVTRDTIGRAASAVIVEIQLGIDSRKRFTWPVYVAVARANLECPITLLVIAPEVAVARWAATPIYLGAGATWFPTVISLGEIPRVTDAATAATVPELSVLSAIAHEDREIIELAATTIFRLGDEEARVYLDRLDQLFPGLTRSVMDYFKNYQYKGEFALKHRGEGRTEARREILLRLIALKFGALSPQLEARIAQLDSERQQRALDRILTADSIDALLAD